MNNPSRKLTHAIHLLDQLNTQIGITGALVVEQYHQQRQLAAPPPPPQNYYPYPPQYGQPPVPGYYPPQPGYAPPPPQYQQPPAQPNPQDPNANQSQVPPIAQDFASLANILTQIQYDLFDINVTLAQGDTPELVESRIDDKAIAWMSDIITKISSQLPAHQDPILPIGNQIANNFYLTKNFAQQALLSLESIDPDENQSRQFNLHKEYITQLQTFMFTCFRWANLVLKEKDWYWKPKSQMQEQSKSEEPQPTTQTVYSNNQPSYQTPQDQPDNVSRN